MVVSIQHYLRVREEVFSKEIAVLELVNNEQDVFVSCYLLAELHPLYFEDFHWGRIGELTHQKTNFLIKKEIMISIYVNVYEFLALQACLFHISIFVQPKQLFICE